MAMTISGTSGVTFPDSTSMTTGQQACKAWVCFNPASSAAILSSYNVSSITVNGTGNFTVNITNALANANYASVGSASYTDTSTVRVVVFNPNTRTTTQCQLTTISASNTATSDPTRVSVAIFD